MISKFALAFVFLSFPVHAQIKITPNTEKSAILLPLKAAVETMKVYRDFPDNFRYINCPVFLRPGQFAPDECKTPAGRRVVVLQKMIHHCETYRIDLAQEEEAKPWAQMSTEDVQYYWDDILPCFAFANELRMQYAIK